MLRNSLRFRRVLFASLASLCLPVSTALGMEMMSVPYFLNPVSSPKSVREVARDCMYRSDPCRAAVEAAGYAVGVPPGAIYETMKTADQLGFGIEQNLVGEETSVVITAPSGWEVCNAVLNPISAAPAGGKYSPTFSIAIDPQRIGITMFVHRLGLGKGRSWWEGSLFVNYVKSGNGDAKNGCVFRTQRMRERQIRYICRGRDGHDELPGCKARSFYVKPR